METMTKKRLFFAHQHEEEEIWLSELSQKGWHLICEPGIFIYTFEKDPYKKYVYRLDYDPDDKTGIEMAKFYIDMGWSKIGKLFNGWYYFRKEAGSAEEHLLYSDTASKIELYKRIRKRIGLTALIIPLPLIPLFSSLIAYNQITTYFVMGIISVFVLSAASSLGRVVYKITKKVNKLEREGN